MKGMDISQNTRQVQDQPTEHVTVVSSRSPKRKKPYKTKLDVCIMKKEN